ncbi:hypothetical protein [Nonomuraea endophytica]|uniref:hypothetical protein n=1 Tax=Nonomuraea endophytica TaxID=714136 RepID=UPI0037C7C5C2
MRGEFSQQVIVLIEDDMVPPPAPSAPALMTRLGVIHVSWDGRGSAGEAMPLDFDRALVWIEDPLVAGSTRVVDSLQTAGVVVIGDQPYGADREVWLTALDRSGNQSTRSVVMTIATQPLVGTDVIGTIIDGANIVRGSVNAADAVIANTITGALVQALAIETGHLKANAVTLDKLAAGSVDAARLTATAIDGKVITGAILRTATSNPRIQLGTAGLEAFTPAGVRTVHIDAASGQFSLQSAVSGARISLDTTGLRAFTGDGRQIANLNTATGEFDIIGRIQSGLTGARVVINPDFGSDPEIRFYEPNGHYHYITANVAAPDSLQMGTVVVNNRKAVLQLSHDSAEFTIVDGNNQGPVGLVVKRDGWLDFIGRVGNPGGNGAFTRGEAEFPAGTTGSIGYGFTFTDGVPVIVATMFNIFGPHGVTVSSRSDGGFGFSTTGGAPGAGYRIMYWVWKQ